MRQAVTTGSIFVTASGRKRRSFTSAFVSTYPEYKGRSVPDFCGLVGGLPRAAYITATGAGLVNALAAWRAV